MTITVNITEFTEIPATKQSFSNRSLMFGVGINDSTYLTEIKVNGKRIVCPYYRTWKGILKRCYDKNYQKEHPTYIGCTICEEWKSFNNFKSWMNSQDWFDKAIDKDLLVRGNKLYSPDTCIFVSQEINNLLGTSLANRGKYLIGVSFDKSKRKFESYCSVKGKKKMLGRFTTEKEAHLTYMTYKKQYIITIANEQVNLKLKNALLHIANTEY